ncbi:hypothetical protein QR685DRAFT_595599 [Neurospora intermedia]|uniref:Secreted protein n=1 Tax=Neurospora intermedia TaxID=5142 RepID=A0ABR3DPZ4_NEUIN
MGMKALSLVVVCLPCSSQHLVQARLTPRLHSLPRLRKTACNAPIPESETCMVGMCGRVPQPTVPVPLSGSLWETQGVLVWGLPMHMQPLGLFRLQDGWVSSAKSIMFSSNKECYSNTTVLRHYG